jgi:hypothetical protein
MYQGHNIDQNKVQNQGREEAQGALLLVSSILLQTYNAVTDDAEGTTGPELEVET